LGKIQSAVAGNLRCIYGVGLARERAIQDAGQPGISNQRRVLFGDSAVIGQPKVSRIAGRDGGRKGPQPFRQSDVWPNFFELLGSKSLDVDGILCDAVAEVFDDLLRYADTDNL